MQSFFKRTLNLATAALLAFAVALPVALPAHAAAMTDYLENKLLDWLIRGQTMTQLTNVYVSLHTGACSDSSVGTEVTGGSYARVTVAAAMAQWAGTQSAGSTTASSGTSGTTSNNAAITFPSPTANWGVVTHFGLFDASTSGNMLLCTALTTSKTINNGDAAPSFGIGSLTFQIDN
jgi:hypothetical protein